MRLFPADDSQEPVDGQIEDPIFLDPVWWEGRASAVGALLSDQVADRAGGDHVLLLLGRWKKPQPEWLGLCRPLRSKNWVRSKLEKRRARGPGGVRMLGPHEVPHLDNAHRGARKRCGGLLALYP